MKRKFGSVANRLDKGSTKDDNCVPDSDISAEMGSGNLFKLPVEVHYEVYCPISAQPTEHPTTRYAFRLIVGHPLH